MMWASICVLALGASGLLAAPLTTYDQRQEGGLNLHAILENFVIVLIPSSNTELLNFAAKSNLNKISQVKRLTGHRNNHNHVKHVASESELEASSDPVTEEHPNPAEVMETVGQTESVGLQQASSQEKNIDQQVVVARSPTVSFTNHQSNNPTNTQTDNNKERDELVSRKESSDADARKQNLERFRTDEELLLSEDKAVNRKPSEQQKAHGRSRYLSGRELVETLRYGLSPAY